MSRGTVFVTDFEFSHLDYEREELAKFDLELEAAQGISGDEVIARAGDAIGLLVQYMRVTPDFIARLPNLRAIARYGVGVDAVALDAASARGIFVINVPDYCEDEVSDHAIGLLLACNRRLIMLDRLVRNGVWDYKRGGPVFRLRGRRLGLIALGRIARLVARKAQALGLEVVAFDPYVNPGFVTDSGVELLDFQGVIKTSHFVSLHAPLTEETHHLIDEPALRVMRNDAYLINTSRGGLIKEPDLIRALREGWIRGAGLDVLEDEPIPKDHPFLTLENVILTPHSAWNSITAEEELRRKAARSLGHVLSGNTFLPNIVNAASIRGP